MQNIQFLVGLVPVVAKSSQVHVCFSTASNLRRAILAPFAARSPARDFTRLGFCAGNPMPQNRFSSRPIFIFSLSLLDDSCPFPGCSYI